MAQMSPEDVLQHFTYLIEERNWRIAIEKLPLIRVYNPAGKITLCPLCAMYYDITSGGVIIGSFAMPELQEFGLDSNDAVELAHAIDCCDCGKRYDRWLRLGILQSLRAPQQYIDEFTALLRKR